MKVRALSESKTSKRTGFQTSASKRTEFQPSAFTCTSLKKKARHIKKIKGYRDSFYGFSRTQRPFYAKKKKVSTVIFI